MGKRILYGLGALRGHDVAPYVGGVFRYFDGILPADGYDWSQGESPEAAPWRAAEETEFVTQLERMVASRAG